MIPFIPHRWREKKLPTTCNHCTSLIGYRDLKCTVCNFVVHKSCERAVVVSCHPEEIPTIPAKLTKELEDELPYVREGYHYFSRKTYKRPTYCNFCRKLLVGLMDQGLCCIRCKLNIHDGCLAKLGHVRTCRPAFLPPDAILYQPPKNTDHHWVESDGYGTCKGCNHSRISSQFLSGQKCSWCRIMVHHTCKAEFDNKSPRNSVCTLGEFSQLIVPPHAFRLQEDNTFKVELDEEDQDLLRPLVVFINKRSGGQQGHFIFSKFQRILNPLQVFDLSKGGPLPGLTMFKHLKNWSILACGGDGTVGWVLSVLDTLKLPNPPPVGVLPLGTGNDLARTLHWGPGYTSESINSILQKIIKSHSIVMDRWQVSIAEKEGDEFGPFKPTHVMNNYFSIGIDAKIALSFHKERELSPEKFKSRTGNKMKYGLYALDEIMSSTSKPIREIVEIDINGTKYHQEGDLYGIIVLNLPSYAGGVNLWGRDEAKPVSISDKKIEIVGVKSVVHMGQCQAKVASGCQVLQAREITITFLTNEPQAVQVDGEPWEQKPCKIHIQLLNQVNMLCQKESILIP